MSRGLTIDNINSKYQGAHLHSEYHPPVRALPHIQSNDPHYINRNLRSVINYPPESNTNQINEQQSHQMRESITKRVIVNPVTLVSNRTKRYEVLDPIIQQQYQTQQQWGHHRQKSKGQRPLSISREKENAVNAPPPPLPGMRSRSNYKNSGFQTSSRRCDCFSQKCLAWVCFLLCLFVVVPLIVLAVYVRRSNSITTTELNALDKQYPSQLINTQLISQADRDFAKEINLILSKQLEVLKQGNQIISSPNNLLTAANPNIFSNNLAFGQQNRCRKAFFFFEGKCLSCPDDSFWDGQNCVKYVVVNKTQQIQRNMIHYENNLSSQLQLTKNQTKEH